ncbi:hypothetical protein MMPV_000480 [Pyropia vietnamensis]
MLSAFLPGGVSCLLPTAGNDLASQNDNLLSSIRGTKRGVESTVDTTAAVMRAIDALENACDGQGDDDGGNWVNRLAGRWRLLFSTESGLTALMGGRVPLVSAADVYQLVESEGSLKNVVEFSRKGSSPAATDVSSAPVRSTGAPRPTPAGSLIVSVEAVPNATVAPVRRMDFVFRRTGVRWGAEGGFDLPFAVGRGHFDVLHLDEALRVDRDANGWVNVYAYDGPVTRCTVGE